MAFYTFASMSIQFSKYQGTGNDFVMIDNRDGSFPKNNTQLVASFCDRKFGIGADGLILLENHPTADFKMVYYNADGNLSSMCGNGGRCITSFAKQLGIIESSAIFEAVDGLHHAQIRGEVVSLKMNDVAQIIVSEEYAFLNTGSPHHVAMVEDLKNFDVKKEGAYIRYKMYGETGSNVNFVEEIENDLFLVRTYERGVEDETLSCGTGAIAVALVLYEREITKMNPIMLKTAGGMLTIHFTKTNGVYQNVCLEGPVSIVFNGSWV